MAFTTPNDRIFYACQAVLVVDRNTPTGDTPPTDTSSKYLTGVQSIGVNTSTPSSIMYLIAIIKLDMKNLICFFKKT